jgi:hypothetical protein
MIGAVSTRSVYLEPDIDCGLPSHCCVLGISKLLQQLLMEAVDVPVQYEAASRGDAIMNLILHELRVAPATHSPCHSRVPVGNLRPEILVVQSAGDFQRQ